jgi:hypothetical protein
MDKDTLFWIALALAWLSGALFGMGFERRLLERKNRNSWPTSDTMKIYKSKDSFK